MKPTQEQRLLAYLESHPGASSLEITQATWIINVTGRISDLRAKGHRIDCRRVDGRERYFLVVEGQATLGLVG